MKAHKAFPALARGGTWNKCMEQVGEWLCQVSQSPTKPKIGEQVSTDENLGCQDADDDRKFEFSSLSEIYEEIIKRCVSVERVSYKQILELLMSQSFLIVDRDNISLETESNRFLKKAEELSNNGELKISNAIGRTILLNYPRAHIKLTTFS